TAVRRPPRVADADGPVHRALAQKSFQDLDASRRPADLQSGGADDRHAGRVVPAVLETLQPFDDDVHRILFTDVSDDAAHVTRLLPASSSICAPWPRPSLRASSAARA